MAELWGITADQFDKRHRRLIRQENLGEDSRHRVQFALAAVADIGRGLVQQEKEKNRLASEDALLLEGDSSDPVLRRMRLAKAKLAEHELALKQQQVVPVDTAISILAVVAAKLRRLGERLEKVHGREVGDEIERVLNETQADLDAAFGPTEPDIPEEDTDDDD